MSVNISSIKGQKQKFNRPEIMERLQEEEQLHKRIYTYPKDFDFKEEKNIKKFSERLNEIQKLRKEESKNFTKTEILTMENVYKSRKNWASKDLAKDLGITPVMVSKYKNGKTPIPKERLPQICSFYGVTAHYLLGLTNDRDGILEFDNNGNIIYDNNGKPKEIKNLPIEFTPVSALQAIYMYGNLYDTNRSFFWLISQLMNASKQKQLLCIDILARLLNSSF